MDDAPRAAPEAAPAPSAAPSAPAPVPAPPAADVPDVPDAPPEEHAPPANLLDRLPWWTAPAILLGVPLLVWLGVLLAPETVYDRFVWKYYWGPIKADALPGDVQFHNGVAAYSGYNVVNTMSWMVLLAVALLGMAQMLHRLRTPMDARLILAATTWVVAGSVFHVMQDVDLFATPLEYFFITPPIYLLFAAFGILSFLAGHYLRWVERQAGREAALQKLWMLQSILVLTYVALWSQDWGQVVHYPNPLWFAGLSALTFFLVRARTLRTGIDPTALTGWLSIPAFGLSILYLVGFVRGDWGLGPDEDAMTSVWLLATGGALAATLLVYAVARGRSGPFATALHHPINLTVVFAHTLDGLATAIGIDAIGGYREKHVVSELVRKSFEDLSQRIGWEFGAENPTFLAFLPLKFLLGLLVVYGIDVAAKEDARRYPVLMGLMKFAIIMVGLGPGIRNMVRMSLGV